MISHLMTTDTYDTRSFIWGLDEADAIEKIKAIEDSIRNAILEEVTASLDPACCTNLVLTIFISNRQFVPKMQLPLLASIRLATSKSF